MARTWPSGSPTARVRSTMRCRSRPPSRPAARPRTLEGEPDWRGLPARVPSRIRGVLKRCLTKDPKQRLRDIGDARLELEQVLALGVSGAIDAAKSDAGARRGLPWWTVAAAALV